MLTHIEYLFIATRGFKNSKVYKDCMSSLQFSVPAKTFAICENICLNITPKEPRFHQILNFASS